MKKRIIALLLVLCLLPAAAALAAEDAAETDRLAFSRAELTGVCVTAEGKLLAADGWNKVIWDLSGETPVIYAGRIGAADLSGEPQGRYFDSTERLRAFFRSPAGIAPFLKGWAVADTEANVIRYVTDKAVHFRHNPFCRFHGSVFRGRDTGRRACLLSGAGFVQLRWQARFRELLYSGSGTRQSQSHPGFTKSEIVKDI